MVLLIKSIVIGICAILPGVSGSVIAVSFGIYEPFINNISSLRNIKNNKRFLITIIFGIIVGVYITSYFLLSILQEVIVYYVLVGIILSEIPFLIKNIKNKTNKNIQMIPCIISFLLSLLLNVISNSGVTDNSPFKFFIGGILFSFGKVFPGISSSFFLLSLGIYDNIILLIMNPLLLVSCFKIYLPFIIGTILGTMLFILLLKYLMKNKYRLTYSMIIGFVLSSVITLIPLFKFDIKNLIGFILMIMTLIISIRIKKTY